MVTKSVGVYPATKALKYKRQEGMYTTLLMSTGLTFGTISALFGLSHNVINQNQYSYIVATVIASAVIPTLIANAFFLPRYLLPKPHAKTLRHRCRTRDFRTRPARGSRGGLHDLPVGRITKGALHAQKDPGGLRRVRIGGSGV